MTETPIALITGGARGIGRACAEAIAETGARIVVADIDAGGVAGAARDLGGGAMGIACDVADEAQVGAMFDRVEAELGPVSILVNGAGIAGKADFLEVTPEEFRRVIDVNLTGSFLVLQRAARTMVARGTGGAIVNFSSVNAQVTIPSIAAYCASKGGIMQLTKAAAIALAPHNVRVNAVGPGSVDTAMLGAVNTDPEAMATILSRTPMKRIARPREVADVVAFLVSPKASYVTGETVYIDGGRLGLHYTC